MASEAGLGEQSSEAGLGEKSSGTPTPDLLSRFGISGFRDAALTDGVSGGEVELGLSLAGYFEAEPEKNRVVRALPISMYDDEGAIQPIEGKEELRKRKEFQSSKRLEAMRRRFEKRESRNGATGAKHDIDRLAVDRLSRLQSISQRSVGSQGSSDLSDFDCRLELGSDSCKEARTFPLGIPLWINQTNTIIPIKDKQTNKMFNIANPITFMEEDKKSKEKFDIADKAKELERSMLEEKLSVYVQGDGPNGRMIQGLLYKYENGMDVKIVCVCHGSFLTPAEFVKHAGGGDVEHPLRHIVVSRPVSLG